MKIGKSVVNFSLKISTGCRRMKYASIEDVPYWSLYSRPGDCIEKELGCPWRSDRVFTLAELKQYLEQYPGRRLLNAYPRISNKQRISYATLIQGETFLVYGKWDGEIYATFVIKDKILHNTYISPNAPSPLSYYRKVAAYEAWIKSIITYNEYEDNVHYKENNKN